MSTDAQLKGDSLRRQREQSREYAAQQGWDLLEADEMRDIGISAFTGANVAEGALGQFLRAIREGRVESGSFIIVESLDRLSRQQVLTSLGIFLQIVNAGINLVTLTDGQTYSAGTTDFQDLIFSIASMSRAHDESRTKSNRLSAAWSRKRQNADNFKLTERCPAWLSLSKDKKTFEVIPERAKVIVSIFEESAAGIGNYALTKRLNRAGMPTFGQSRRGWGKSSVAKILTNRAVLGEFQPHRMQNGKRVPTGEVIKNYFPPIVDEALFYRAQSGRIQRRSGGSGRKGQNISNLFSSLAICAYCRSRMRFENKGKGPKGGTYLVCDSRERGFPCEKVAWRYAQFEASFLAFVTEVDLQSLVRDEAEIKRRVTLDKEIAAIRGELAHNQEQRDRTYDLFAKATLSSDFVAQKLNECEQNRIRLDAELKEKTLARGALDSDLTEFYKTKEEIKALIQRLQQPSGEETYRLRAQIASRLRSLVSTILVAPAGSSPSIRKALVLLKDDPAASDVVQRLNERLSHEQGKRWFAVGFKDGSVRAIYPSDHDPLQFDEQVVSSLDGGMARIFPTFTDVIFPPKAPSIEDVQEVS